MHSWQFDLDPIDHVKRRSVGSLGHRNVNRTAAIHQSVAGQHIAAVIHGRDVAQINSRAGAHPDRERGQLLNLGHDRVNRREAVDVARSHVAGRKNYVS